MTEEIIIDENEEPELGKRNKGINTLTILTIIGCVIMLGFILLGEMNMDTSYDQHVMIQEGGTTGIEWTDRMLRNSWDSFQIMYENRYTMLSIGIIGVLLCLIGAILMRKGNLKGLWLWLAGEWIPLFLNLAIIGTSIFQGWQLSTILIPIVFTALYFRHKKYLV